MRRGTTPTITVTNLPVDFSEISELLLIFRPEKKEEIILEKNLSESKIINNILTFTLSQEDTLKFPVGIVRRSIVIKTINGSRLESIPDFFTVYDTAKNEVI